MKRQAAGLVAVVMGMVLAGCSSNATTGTASRTPSPASNTIRPKVMPLGTVGTLTDRNGNPEATVQITGLQPKARMPGIATRGGTRQIATVTAKACNGPQSRPGELNWGPFALTLNDGTVAEALNQWSDTWFTKPLFPQNRTVQPGDCVKGIVPFAIPASAKPVRVEYQVPGGDTLLWSAGQ